MMSIGAYAVVLSLLQSVVLPVADGANILVFMPMPLKSHFSGFQPMFEELAHRGHNVTVVSAFPLQKNRRVSNYTDIDVSPPNIPSKYILIEFLIWRFKIAFFFSIIHLFLFIPMALRKLVSKCTIERVTSKWNVQSSVHSV